MNNRRIRNNIATPFASLAASYQLLKFITIFLIIVVLTLSISLYLSISKRSIIVGVAADGVPLNLEIVSDSVINVVNYKQFVTHFLNCVYNWNPATVNDQISRSIAFMSRDLKAKYIAMLNDKSYMENLLDYNITNVFQIQKIDDRVVGNKGIFTVTVWGTRLRVTEFIDRTVPLKVHIKIRPVALTKENVWGLEVIELIEEEVK